MAGNFFRGTSVEQDGRWGKSDQKLMEKMTKAGKFAAILDSKVNFKKVNLDVISKWVHEKIIELVGFEDEILINLVNNMLQGGELEGKKLQLDVTGFLGKQTGAFVEELWTFLVDAQNQPNGIPSAFIQKKKQEIINRQQNLVQKILDNDTGGSWSSSAPTGNVLNSEARNPETKNVVESVKDDRIIDDKEKERSRLESSRSIDRYRDKDSRGNGTSNRSDREGFRREEPRPSKDDYQRHRDRETFRDRDRDSRYRDDYDRDRGRNRGRDDGRDGGYTHRRRDSRSRSAERSKRRDSGSSNHHDADYSDDRKKRARSRSASPDTSHRERERRTKHDDHEKGSSSKRHRDRDEEQDAEKDKDKDKDRKEKKSKKHKDKDKDKDKDRKKEKKTSSASSHRSGDKEDAVARDRSYSSDT